MVDQPTDLSSPKKTELKLQREEGAEFALTDNSSYEDLGGSYSEEGGPYDEMGGASSMSLGEDCGGQVRGKVGVEGREENSRLCVISMVMVHNIQLKTCITTLVLSFS